MIADTLATLDTWYNEPTAGSARPKLLSKLALLELCGWIETEQDRIVLVIDSTCLKDPTWTKKEIIEKNFGFDYKKHFRPMIVKVLGEHIMRKLEERLDGKYPGKLEVIRSYTSELWVTRCNFAHEDVVASIAKQQRFDAPSWCINRHRILSNALAQFEAEAVALTCSL